MRTLAQKVEGSFTSAMSFDDKVALVGDVAESLSIRNNIQEVYVFSDTSVILIQYNIQLLEVVTDDS